MAARSAIRLGLLGTENTHAEQFLRSFNVGRRHPGVRVDALVGSGSHRDRSLQELGQVASLVPAAADLLGLVDGVLVCGRHGAHHLEDAAPFLAAGLPVFIDKPMALSTADAEQLLRLAAVSGVPLTSFSGLRLHSRIVSLAANAATSPPDRLVVTGPADPGSPFGGIAFYGTHLVEVAATVLNAGSMRVVEVREEPGQVVAQVEAGSAEVRFEFLADPAQRWSVTTVAGTATRRFDVLMDEDELERGSAAVAAFFASGTRPLSDAQLVAPVRVLEAIAHALAPIAEARA